MPITNKYKRIKLTQILVREDRQRRTVEVDDLVPSILKRGVLQPIIVEALSDDQYNLVAGERRFRASVAAGLPDIPARMVDDLTETERQILELEENVKRHDLPWKEEVAAVARIHKLYTSAENGWTQAKTADAIGMQTGLLSMILKVAEALSSGNAQVAAATGYRPAYNLIQRKEGRLADDAMNDLMAPEESAPLAPAEVEAEQEHKAADHPPRTSGPKYPAPKPPESILVEDFCDWVKTYKGQPFSFLHCDFPYGIGLDKSEQAGSAQHGGYGDSDALYWQLCSCLADNLDKVMMQSAHLMFWTSSRIDRQFRTIKFFNEKAPSLDFNWVPIIWLKTDNKGILPDPKRGPRQIVETALLASRGDRHIIKAVSNGYGSPSTKETHQSEKPEPMLRHYFQMFVDENTRMLDPTCGSGSALRAAESLGAKHVLGLEVNPEFADAARIALRKSRNLRALEKKS